MGIIAQNCYTASVFTCGLYYPELLHCITFRCGLYFPKL